MALLLVSLFVSLLAGRYSPLSVLEHIFWRVTPVTGQHSTNTTNKLTRLTGVWEGVLVVSEQVFRLRADAPRGLRGLRGNRGGKVS